MRRHEKIKHISNPITNNNNLFGSGYNVGNIHGLFDIRLKKTLNFLLQDLQDVERQYLYQSY